MTMMGEDGQWQGKTDDNDKLTTGEDNNNDEGWQGKIDNDHDDKLMTTATAPSHFNCRRVLFTLITFTNWLPPLPCTSCEVGDISFCLILLPTCLLTGPCLWGALLIVLALIWCWFELIVVSRWLIVTQTGHDQFLNWIGPQWTSFVQFGPVLYSFGV